MSGRCCRRPGTGAKLNPDHSGDDAALPLAVILATGAEENSRALSSPAGLQFLNAPWFHCVAERHLVVASLARGKRI